MKIEFRLAKLTPADFGVIAATLDDVADCGDDGATDDLAKAIEFELGFAMPSARRIAYHVVHVLKRKVS